MIQIFSGTGVAFETIEVIVQDDRRRGESMAVCPLCAAMLHLGYGERESLDKHLASVHPHGV